MTNDVISLSALNCFADVARRGSFAAAARVRNVDPSIISRNIASMERELGFLLFDRTTRRLNLTEAGEIYLERSQTLVGELEAARLEAGDVVTRPSGLVRVTASTAFGVQWLTPRLHSFMDAFPDISVEARLTDAIVDIAAERIDLAIRLAVQPEGELVASKLMDTRYRIVASPRYVAREGPLFGPADLGGRDCLLLTLPGYRSHWTFRRGEEETEVAVSGQLVISSPAAIRAAALDGMGPTLLADWMVRGDLETGSLLDLLPEWEASAAGFDTAAWLLYPSRKYVPRKVRALIDHLKASVDMGR
ncbi:MAG: LysR substrate-binding domain-containing protein [Pseudomonadota bacterium]